MLRENREQEARNQAIQEVADQINELMHQKNTLEKELKQIQNQYVESLADQGMMGFIITDIEDGFITKTIVPQFESKNWVANLAITPEQYPGADGYISEDSAKELIQKGWGLAYYCTDTTDLDKWLLEASSKLEEADLESPSVLYLSPDLYKEYQDKLKSVCNPYGIEIIVTYVKDGRYRANDTIEESLWVIHAEGWLSDSCTEKISLTASEHDMFCFVIGNKNVDSTIAFDGEEFTAMQEYLKDYERSAAISIREITSTHEERRKAIHAREAGLKEMDASTKASVDKIEAEIKTLDEEIQGLQSGLRTEGM